MKKLKLFALLSLGFMALGGIVLGTAQKSYVSVAAEPDDVSESTPDSSEEPVDPVDPEEPEEEVYECKVILNVLAHGKVKVDKTEGHVGDIVTVTADADLFYIIDYAECNGSALIESEETTGVYKFALVEGENRVTVRFVIDEKLLGEMSTMVEQASNKDWTNLFSIKNVITLVSCLLNGGLLIAIVRYFVKDKRLEKKVEDKIEKTVAEVVPDATKNIIVDALKELLAPYFAKIESGVIDIQEVTVVLCRCFALMQENTPEARIAITKELSSLKLSDKASIAMIEEKIKDFVKEQGDRMANVLAKLGNIEQSNKQIIDKAEEKPELDQSEELKDDGTQI